MDLQSLAALDCMKDEGAHTLRVSVCVRDFNCLQFGPFGLGSTYITVLPEVIDACIGIHDVFVLFV